MAAATGGTEQTSALPDTRDDMISHLGNHVSKMTFNRTEVMGRNRSARFLGKRQRLLMQWKNIQKYWKKKWQSKKRLS